MRSNSIISSAWALIFSFFSTTACFAGDNKTLEEALQLQANIDAGKKIYVLCAACHGEDGLGQQAGEFPSIAGQHQAVIVKQLIDIQQKKRINPTMFPFSDMQTLGGPQGLVDVAAYTASLTPGNDHVTGDGEHLDRGQTLYQSSCITCHGQDAAGNETLFYPRISHQHYPYLVRELGWIRDKVRKNADPTMVQILQDFSPQDIQAVADYLSRLQ